MVGAKLARKRLTALRFSADVVAAVSELIELHLRFHGYADGEWTDAAVRRYVRDAGDQLERLHILTRADCTTRNAAKATRLRSAYDELEHRIDELAAEEELNAMRPDLDGRQIMEILQIPAGPLVGEAYRFLLERRDRGRPARPRPRPRRTPGVVGRPRPDRDRRFALRRMRSSRARSAAQPHMAETQRLNAGGQACVRHRS